MSETTRPYKAPHPGKTEPNPSQWHQGRRKTSRSEVIRLLNTGMTNRQVAEELGVSPQTVRHHRRMAEIDLLQQQLAEKE